MSLFEAHGILPRDARNLTLYQYRCLVRGAEKTEQMSRYCKMRPEVRAKADEYKARYGSF